MSQFYSLAIADIRRETGDCVSISFEIPEELQQRFIFSPGQNITLKLHVDGEELRRSYSICSSPLDNELRIAVKKITAGRFSYHANHRLQKGDRIDVMPPGGKFGMPAGLPGNCLAIAAGSGITPIISIIKTILANSHSSRVTLLYGNRSRAGIIFREQLEALKNKYMERFVMHHVFSREATDAPVNNGRINAEKCEQLFPWLINPETVQHAFVCGPQEMIFDVRDWLLAKGLSERQVHYELFTVPGQRPGGNQKAVRPASNKTCEVSLKLDGSVTRFALPFDGPSLLDAALREGADLPFACKGGVCATCRARLISGEVIMDNNYALEPEELRQGYILTCQSHPMTETLFVDFDSK